MSDEEMSDKRIDVLNVNGSGSILGDPAPKESTEKQEKSNYYVTNEVRKTLLDSFHECFKATLKFRSCLVTQGILRVCQRRLQRFGAMGKVALSAAVLLSFLVATVLVFGIFFFLPKPKADGDYGTGAQWGVAFVIIAICATFCGAFAFALLQHCTDKFSSLRYSQMLGIFLFILSWFRAFAELMWGVSLVSDVVADGLPFLFASFGVETYGLHRALAATMFAIPSITMSSISISQDSQKPPALAILILCFFTVAALCVVGFSVYRCCQQRSREVVAVTADASFKRRAFLCKCGERWSSASKRDLNAAITLDPRGSDSELLERALAKMGRSSLREMNVDLREPRGELVSSAFRSSDALMEIWCPPFAIVNDKHQGMFLLGVYDADDARSKLFVIVATKDGRLVWREYEFVPDEAESGVGRGVPSDGPLWQRRRYVFVYQVSSQRSLATLSSDDGGTRRSSVVDVGPQPVGLKQANPLPANAAQNRDEAAGELQATDPLLEVLLQQKESTKKFEEPKAMGRADSGESLLEAPLRQRMKKFEELKHGQRR